MDKTNRKIDINVNLISELEDKLKNLKAEKEDQKNRFIELERIEQIKYEDVERKYKDLVKKSKEYEIVEDIRESEMITAQMKMTQDRNNQQDKEM